MRTGPARGIVSLTSVAVLAVLTGSAAAESHAVAAAPQAAGVPAAGPGEWPVAGQNVMNTRNAAAEHGLGPRDVTRLAVAWSLTTGGDVRATPVEADGTVYVPDSAGTLWAVAADTGRVRWSHAISGYTGITGDVSRGSPAVYRDELVLGDTETKGLGAYVVAVDRRTGQRRWVTEVDTHPAAIVTGAAVVYQGVVYVGVSSYEEALAVKTGYPCCTFRGSLVALDAVTGRLLWKTFTVPVGYAGAAVWGSTPAVDPRNNLVYVGTGNNYAAPPGVCTGPGETGCAPPVPADHADSVLAIDRTTGAVRWYRSTLESDVFTEVCGVTRDATCGPDFDFGSGPNLIRLPSGRRLVGIGQKSGVYWALDPETGSVVWHTTVGPGSALGGVEFGSATDGRRIYVAISDLLAKPYRITSADGVTATISGGSWAALDAATGRILWQVADPQGAADVGYVSSANGVVYAGSTAGTGDDMYALDARTGRVRWRFAGGGPVVSGAATVRGSVYWGSGYTTATACPGGKGAIRYCPGAGDKLYAFRVPD